MPESNHEPPQTRAQRRDQHTMPHTTTPIIGTLVVQAAQESQLGSAPSDPTHEAVQLACARWLAGYRASQGLYVGQVVERTTIRPDQLLALDTGLAWPGMLTAAQEEALRGALAPDDEGDKRTIELLLTVALGYAGQIEAPMLDWLLDDLEHNVWRQPDLESAFTEYFSPADTHEVEAVHRVLTKVQLLLLQILFLGPKNSQELHDEAVRRRVWGKAGLDSATFAAVVDFLLTHNLIEVLDDKWNSAIQRSLLHFQLTTLGLRVVALQRHIEQAPTGRSSFLARLRSRLREQQKLRVNTT